MKTIWKYELKPDKIIYDIPEGAKVLCVMQQGGNICIWVEVDPDKPKVKRSFRVYGTGHDIAGDTDKDLDYIGSVKLNQGSYVFHIYEYIG